MVKLLKVIMLNIIDHQISIILKNVFAEDSKNNQIITEFAEYNGLTKLFISRGTTRIITSENYKLDGQDIEYDSNLKKIRSKKNNNFR